MKVPAQQLAAAVVGLRKAFPTQDFDPGDLPLRAHEILENALQFELTGDTDEGSGTNLATVDSNLAGTRELLTVLKPLLTKESPKLLPGVDADIARLQKLLDSAHQGASWTPSSSWTRRRRPDSTAPPVSCWRTWHRCRTCWRSGSPPDEHRERERCREHRQYSEQPQHPEQP